MNCKNPYEVISSYELADELRATLQPELRITSGIPSLDKAVDGFSPGELYIISGPTKHGKTLFAQSLTNQFIRQNANCLWFSFEVQPQQFLASFPELPLFFLPRKLKPNAMDWLIGRMDESRKKYQTRVVFIDHLHYLFDMARSKNSSIEIGTVIRILKINAVSSGYLIFLLAHTRKGNYGKEKITYDAIRDSSFVAQESDCVIMIARNIKDPESCEAMVSIEFHRRTGVLNKKIHLRKVGGYLVESAHPAYNFLKKQNRTETEYLDEISKLNVD